MNRSTYDFDDIMEKYEDNENDLGYHLKIGMIDFTNIRSTCANCLEEIVKPIPMIDIWKHKEHMNNCISPKPAPTVFLLQLKNVPQMRPNLSYGRKKKPKITCKKCFYKWNNLIHEWLGIKAKSKSGWWGVQFVSHYMLDNYSTKCGIQVQYDSRKDGIKITKKIPEHPIRANRYVICTCTICWKYYEKLKEKKK